MSKKAGLPGNLKMRHDWHYVEEISRAQRSIGRILPLEKLTPNPLQPRVDFGDLSDLTASIKEKGVLEPLLVKPLGSQQGWLIIAGERRWRAARAAGLTEVPCIELDLDDNQIAEIALIENLQRKDLTVWEEADGLASLCQRFNYTHEDIAQKIGKSRTTVTESLTIANLPVQVRELAVKVGVKTKSAILQVARQFDEEAMLKHLELLRQQSQSRAENRFDSPISQDNLPVLDQPEDDVQILQNKNVKALSSDSSETNNSQTEQKKQAPTSHNTNLQHPVRVYNYQPEQGSFKLALKFKKPTDKTEIITTLKKIIEELEQ